MKKITQFADKLVDLIRKVEIKTDNNIEAQFFLEMLDLFVLAEKKERDELKKYEDLEEQGLLLKLPCKIGRTVYAIGERYIAEYKVKNYIFNETGITAIRVLKRIGDCDYFNTFYMEDFNKTVFLTREEAEAALRKIRGVIKIGRRSLDEMINLYKLKSEALQTIEHVQVLEYLRELKEYREFEEQKLFVGLPLCIGETIYINRLLSIQEYKVEEYFINKNGIKKIIAVKSEEETLSKEYKAFTAADIGTTVFLTKEAAERARKIKIAW